MDNLLKNKEEIRKKQKKLGKLTDEQQDVYAIVKEKIAGMSKKQRIKLLKKGAVDKMIADAREELCR